MKKAKLMSLVVALAFWGCEKSADVVNQKDPAQADGRATVSNGESKLASQLPLKNSTREAALRTNVIAEIVPLTVNKMKLQSKAIVPNATFAFVSPYPAGASIGEAGNNIALASQAAENAAGNTPIALWTQENLQSSTEQPVKAGMATAVEKAKLPLLATLTEPGR